VYRGGKVLKRKSIVIVSAVSAILLVTLVVLMAAIHFREFTTYSKDGFHISYPKDWVVNTMQYTAVADVNYREESGKEGLAKLSPTFILLSAVSNKGEYQYFSVSKYGLETKEQEPIRTQLDKNLEIQKIFFPSIQEIDRLFYLNEEGCMVAQVVCTKDDPAGELGKLLIISRIIDGKDGSRWQIQYVTEEVNFNKYKGIGERILDSFRLNKTIDWAMDWAMVGAIASIAAIPISWIFAVVAPIIKKRGKKRV
jgi:hypothetical protein